VSLQITTAYAALRGLIVGIWLYFALGPIFRVHAPMLVRGGFHLWFVLSFPITLATSVGVAFVPVGGSTLGIVSSGLLALVLALTVSISVLRTAERPLIRHGLAQGARPELA
jgi:hypothetical protein